MIEDIDNKFTKSHVDEITRMFSKSGVPEELAKLSNDIWSTRPNLAGVVGVSVS